jgi:8-oxo-dGTP pyrophosphatase MutT (NUDIX family)
MPKLKGRLVFKGKIFSIYQWKQRMFDGTYAIFERAERSSIVQVLPVVNGKIAIAFEEQPDLKPIRGLIGGIMEEGEAPLASARRELLEETGMTAKHLKRVGTFEDGGKVHFKVHLFAATGCEKVAEQHLDAGERIKIEYVTLDQLLTSVTTWRMRPELMLYFVQARYEKRNRARLRRLLSL